MALVDPSLIRWVSTSIMEIPLFMIMAWTKPKLRLKFLFHPSLTLKSGSERLVWSRPRRDRLGPNGLGSHQRVENREMRIASAKESWTVKFEIYRNRSLSVCQANAAELSVLVSCSLQF